MKMEIEDKHIREAELIFLDGQSFNSKERIPFIKHLETCDLLAVPGSGKTTALMAKLYCLSKHLPFEDGSGILILAHTNAAVEEIENKLKKHCPRLFEYPNFVGTIQTFVNKFISNHASFERYSSYIRKNDDLLLQEILLKKIKAKRGKAFWKLFYTIKGDEKTDEKFLEIIKTIKYNEVKGCFDSVYFKPSLKFTTDSGKELKEIYDELRDNGYLFFFDSYQLANTFLRKHNELSYLLQNRFKYVFIDEMQDLEDFQIDLIDVIFEKGNANSIVQRIGDPNQSIYNKVKDDCDWKPRNEMYLTGSNRLTKSIAELVNCFTFKNDVGKFEVVGERMLDIGEMEIKPHLVLFSKESKDKLKNKFEDLIKEYRLHEIEAQRKGFKIIGWTGERSNEGDGNFCLHTLFGYKKNEKTRKEDFNTLSKYIQFFNQEKDTLESVRKNILNALIAILRLENKKIEKYIRGKKENQYFTKNDLIEFVKKCKNDKSNVNVYEEFKSKLYHWCFDLATKKDFNSVFDSVKDFVQNDFKTWFNLEINIQTREFIKEFKLESLNHKAEIKPEALSIDIATVHSVKGQTHCATMYVETAYKKPVYETLKLKEGKAKLSKSFKNPLYKELHNCSKATSKEALKMMYVGFSRPTHLLCFAVLEDNVKNDLNRFIEAGWEIVKI